MTRFPAFRTALLGLSAALVLSACAFNQPRPPAPVLVNAPPAEDAVPAMTPRTAEAIEALTRMAAQRERLYRVAAPMLINNADLCKTHARNLLGFTAQNRASFPGELGDAAHAAFGLGERLQVSGVLAGSGAARAGLKKGDGLIAAEGKPLPTGPKAETLAGAVFGPLIAAHPSIKMTISRDGGAQSLTIPVTHACGFRVELGNADNVNSYADGERIMLTRGMLAFASSDEQLAFVIAKDMAHNILGHASALRLNSTIGSMIDNLVSLRPDLSLLIGSAGIKPMPQAMDAAADNLGLYLMARAGYNIDGAAHFWRKLGETYPATVLNGYVANHPSTAFRLAAIDKTVAEIKLKQANHKPLTP